MITATAKYPALRPILLIEESGDGAHSIKRALDTCGYHVLQATERMAVLRLHARERPALVIVDGMILKQDEIEMLHRMQQSAHIPVLLITARSEAGDRVVALELGVDDTPRLFSLREFVAWIKALLRRAELVEHAQQVKPVANAMLTYQALCLDPQTYRVELNGGVIDLSPSEFALLHLLLRSPGHVFRRGYLLDLLWGEGYVGGDRTIDNLVLRLRKKLGSLGQAIETVWGIGYRLRPESW